MTGEGTIKEGIVRGWRASEHGNEQQEDHGGSIDWCTCWEARKCPQIITKTIHQAISRLLFSIWLSLSLFLSLSLTLLSFLFLIYVLPFYQYPTFPETRNSDCTEKEGTREQRVGENKRTLIVTLGLGLSHCRYANILVKSWKWRSVLIALAVETKVE